jgi:2,3-dihydroxybiphenyl 1,2-dioxygenase
VKGPTNLTYLIIRATDLDAWERFGEDIVGFQLAEKTADRLIFRMDRLRHRITVERGSEDDIVASGWLFDSPEDLGDFSEHLKSRGYEVFVGSPELLAARYVGALCYIDGPNGVRHEFVANPVVADGNDRFVSKVLEGKFVTGRLGLGHYIEVASDYKKSFDYLKDVIGVKVSGFMRSPGLKELEVAFFHSATGRYHSIGTAALPIPKKCFHVGLELETLNDVGRALDRAAADKIVEKGFGFHPNAETLSFYFRTPSGFWFEMGFGEIVIDDNNWHVETHYETSSWGHKPFNSQG